MKNILIAAVILTGLLVLVLQPSITASAGPSDCSINASLSGPGSTSATVYAIDETNGMRFSLSPNPLGGSNYYSASPVNCNYYTIRACASNSSGTVFHVNFNTIGYITMQGGQCIPD